MRHQGRRIGRRPPWVAATLAALALLIGGSWTSVPEGPPSFSNPRPDADPSQLLSSSFAPSTAHAQGRDLRFRPTLIELEDVAQLQARFQADDHLPRLLIVLSPT